MTTSRTRFYPGDPRAAEAGRKSRKVSPWGRVPYNRNAKRTLRLEAIKRAAGRAAAAIAKGE